MLKGLIRTILNIVVNEAYTVFSSYALTGDMQVKPVEQL